MAMTQIISEKNDSPYIQRDDDKEMRMILSY